jgi:hypothetical protein
LYAYKTAESAVAPFQFLHHETISNVIHVGASVLFRQIAAVQSHLGHLRNDLAGKCRFLEMFIDDGNDPFVYEPADGVTHHPFFVAQ